VPPQEVGRSYSRAVIAAAGAGGHTAGRTVIAAFVSNDVS
jgi:hypothetical protein